MGKKGILGGNNGHNRCSLCLGRWPSHKTIGGKLSCGMSTGLKSLGEPGMEAEII